MTFHVADFAKFSTSPTSYSTLPSRHPILLTAEFCLTIISSSPPSLSIIANVSNYRKYRLYSLPLQYLIVMMKDDKQSSESDGTTRPSKRPRFQANKPNAPNFIPTISNRRGRQFLRLHLQLLKATYSQDMEYSNNHIEGKRRGNEQTNAETYQDSPIDDSLSNMIEAFLRDRGRARSLDTTVEYYHELYENAVDFIREEFEKEESNRPTVPISPWSLVTPNGNNRHAGYFLHANPVIRSSLLFGGSQQSPFAPTSRMCSHATGMLSSRHLGQGIYGASCTSTDHVSINPFGLVAGLLQLKHQNAVHDLQETTLPFEPLINEVTKRIESLEKLLSESQTFDSFQRQADNRGESHPDINSVSCRNLYSPSTKAPYPADEDESEARIETKLRLWRLLHFDLLNR